MRQWIQFNYIWMTYHCTSSDTLRGLIAYQTDSFDQRTNHLARCHIRNPDATLLGSTGRWRCKQACDNWLAPKVILKLQCELRYWITSLVSVEGCLWNFLSSTLTILCTFTIVGHWVECITQNKTSNAWPGEEKLETIADDNRPVTTLRGTVSEPSKGCGTWLRHPDHVTITNGDGSRSLHCPDYASFDQIKSDR